MTDQEEQDWTCPLKLVKITQTPYTPILYNVPENSYELMMNLARSASLGSTLHSKENEADEDEDDDDEEEEEEEEEKSLLRSFTVISKGSTPDKTIWMSPIIATNNNNQPYPDTTCASKKPPLLSYEVRIPNEYGTIHAIAVRGCMIVVGTNHHNVKSYNMKKIADTLFSPIDPSLPTDTLHSRSSSFSNDCIRSVCFSPAMHPKHDNNVLWAGAENGSILAIDVSTDQVLMKRMATHSHPVTFILRNRNTELWTIDHGGNLNIWPILRTSVQEHSSTINLSETTPDRYSVTVATKTALLSSSNTNILWLSSGKTIDRFDRSAELKEAIPVIQPSSDLGEINRVFTIPFHTHSLFALHSEGQISVWHENTFEWLQYISISIDKITTLLAVDSIYLWVGFFNGNMAIYDTRSDPWIVVKIWKAHSSPVAKITVDSFSISDSMPVVSIDSMGHIAIWDGLMADHWLEDQTSNRLNDYCDFNEIKTMICSWNMDAIKPEDLTESDVEKLHEWLNGMEDPDIIMIGVQEIVDLRSTALTAKSFLALNKKIETVQEANELLTYRYLLWHDYFTSIINTNYGKQTYKVIKTDQMVGLFSCVFVKCSMESRIKHCDTTAVKTGFRLMKKSLHGNKGGIATRLVIDDTSICFVNCHLAAGQSNVLARNVDMDGILQSARFLPCLYSQGAFRKDTDGSSILDHEACFLSGDLNYRIGMNRQQVLDLLCNNNSSKNKLEIWESLQQEDQLKRQLALNPTFRIFGFKEPPILFDPTYKYDRGTDLYDQSEKKRTPAWCDRILHRGPSSLSNIYYRRHEVRASDHRPISAGFMVSGKSVSYTKLQRVKDELRREWLEMLVKYQQSNKIRYVRYYDLCDEKEALDRLEKADWDVEKVVMNLYRDKGCYFP